MQEGERVAVAQVRRRRRHHQLPRLGARTGGTAISCEACEAWLMPVNMLISAVRRNLKTILRISIGAVKMTVAMKPVSE